MENPCFESNSVGLSFVVLSSGSFSLKFLENIDYVLPFASPYLRNGGCHKFFANVFFPTYFTIKSWSPNLTRDNFMQTFRESNNCDCYKVLVSGCPWRDGIFFCNCSKTKSYLDGFIAFETPCMLNFIKILGGVSEIQRLYEKELLVSRY